MQVHAIILAGGDGNRFGGELPKQFVRLAGDPILLRTLLAGAGAADRIVVVAHPSWLADTRDLVAAAGLEVPVVVVPGGATRNESTRNGLRAVEGEDDDVVLVHDAVRPLLPLDVIRRSIEPILSGRATHRHGHPQRRHAGHRGRRARRRDPRPVAVPARADAPVVSQAGALAGVRRAAGPATCRPPTTAPGPAPAGCRIVAVAGDEVNVRSPGSTWSPTDASDAGDVADLGGWMRRPHSMERGCW
jgi:CTP:molybdopterin cytidylyltransferase MocA